MSDEPTPSLKDRLKSRLNVSLAAMVAALVGIGLLVFAAAAWLVYSIDPTRIAWGDYMTLQRGVWLLALWALSCVVTYVTVRIWMADIPLGDARVRAGWRSLADLLPRHWCVWDTPAKRNIGRTHRAAKISSRTCRRSI